MKNYKLIVCMTFFSSLVMGQCRIDEPNELLRMVKDNHPRITQTRAQVKVVKAASEIAKQRPNPVLDIQSTVGESIEGDVYSTGVSLKHIFELGNKRGSRIKVAKSLYETELTHSKLASEETIIETVLMMHRLRQVYDLIPLYEEALLAFNKILGTIKKRRSVSPEQEVEGETLEFAVNDYKLKIAQLNALKVDLQTHLRFFARTECKLTQNSLPSSANLFESFAGSSAVRKYSKLKLAENTLSLAQSQLELQKSNSYPNLELGPVYEFEKVNVSQSNTVGISLSIDLPLFNLNRGARLKAAKQVAAARLNLVNTQKESTLDIRSWRLKYNQYKSSLLSTANKEVLEKKHKKIESLFRRGIISTSLVIESHRQLIEFFNTRFEFETGAVEALWNIYKLNGEINNKELR